ncbi:MAG: propanediol utilization protein [Bacilli bacterium]|nr:propanediol utilization protein [Bacilli bacterium]
MKINIGVSARHIHLSKEDYDLLFGEEEFGVLKNLSQYPNFSSDKTVILRNNDRVLKNVRVIGPLRNDTQVELSKTDCVYLRIDAPLCNSGELDEAASIEIINGDKVICRDSVIIQNRHIHMSYEDASNLGYTDDQIVKVKIDSKKGGIIDNVHIKLSDKGTLELQLDTDDANAFLIDNEVKGEIIDD